MVVPGRVRSRARWRCSRKRSRKLAAIPHRLGTLGAPVLDDCYAHFECRVANVMDTGSSTCFLGDVAAVGFGKASGPRGEVMGGGGGGANMPEAWRKEYEELLATAQRYAEQRSRDIRAVTWKGLAPQRDG